MTFGSLGRGVGSFGGPSPSFRPPSGNQNFNYIEAVIVLFNLFTPTTMPHPTRVVIPENASELFPLAGRIYQHHQELGSKSPLNALEGPPTWETAGPQVAEAIKLQEEITEAERRLKGLYGRRQVYIDMYTPLVRSSRDTLLGVYSQNPRRVGEFGFDVKTTEAAKPSPPISAK